MSKDVINRVKSALEYLKRFEGHTANDISSKSKISKPTLAQFKSGNGKPRASTLKKLQKAFPFISNEWLLNGEGEMIVQDKLPNQSSMPVMKRVRLHLGLTQRELADKVGINQGLISHYERTGKELSKKIEAKLSSVYGDELKEIIHPTFIATSALTGVGGVMNLTKEPGVKELFGITYNSHVVCTGNAMSPRFNNGDVLLLRNISVDGIIPFGECFYLSTDGVDLLRIIDSETHDSFVLRSVNTSYLPLNLPKIDVKSIQLVVGKIEPLA